MPKGGQKRVRQAVRGFSPDRSVELSGKKLELGLMRPFLPEDQLRSAVDGVLVPVVPRFGVWYMDRVPREWIMNEEALLAAAPVEVNNWLGVVSMPNADVQSRLQTGTASQSIPVKLGVWGPRGANFGLVIESPDARRILGDEAVLLDVGNKDFLRSTLGVARLGNRPEVNRLLYEACRQENYLGPLCVMNSVLPPTAQLLY